MDGNVSNPEERQQAAEVDRGQENNDNGALVSLLSTSGTSFYSILLYQLAIELLFIAASEVGDKAHEVTDSAVNQPSGEVESDQRNRERINNRPVYLSLLFLLTSSTPSIFFLLSMDEYTSPNLIAKSRP